MTVEKRKLLQMKAYGVSLTHSRSETLVPSVAEDIDKGQLL